MYVTLAFLLITLQSFYFEDPGGAIPPLVGYGMLLLLAALRLMRQPTRALVPIGSLVTASFLALVAVFSLFNNGAAATSLGFALSASALFVVPVAFAGRTDVVRWALTATISLHLAFLALQVAWYSATGIYLDYLAPSDAHAVWNSQKGYVAGGHLVPRFTGMFNEPGTYSGVMGALVASHYVTQQRLGVLMMVAMGSMVATASTTGVVLVVLIAFGVGFDHLRRRRNAPVLFGAIAIVVISAALGIERFFNRLQYTGGSNDVVFQNLSWLADPNNFTLFGHSLVNLPSYVSVEYFGVLMSSYIQFGIAGVVGILVSASVFFAANPFIFLVLLFVKVKITYPLLFVLVGAVSVCCSTKRLAMPSWPAPRVRTDDVDAPESAGPGRA